MKLILIALTITQIYGAFSANIPIREQRGLMATPDSSDSILVEVAQGTDRTIGEVSNAITDAIHNVTLWTSAKSDVRLNLLTELKKFQGGLQYLTLQIAENFRNGAITTEYRQLLSQLDFFLITYLNNINHMITILIPTMEDSRATDAITSCLHLGQVIDAAIKKIHVLISL